MRPNRLKQIKDEQLAEAQKQGFDNYADYAKTLNRAKPNALQAIKNGGNGTQADQNTQTGTEPSTATSDAPQAPAAGDSGRLFDQMKAALDVDVQRLKEKHTLEEKAELKKTLIPNYLPFLADYMNQGHNYPNVVAVTIALWLFDVGEIEHAVNLSLYLAKTPQQHTPTGHERDFKTMVADSVYDWANAQLKDGHSASPYLDNVVAAVIDDEWSLAVPVESKLYAMQAKHEFAKKEFSKTVAWCDLAEKVNPDGHGTKTLRANAVKEIEKAKA